MNKFDRVISILLLLQSRRCVTARDIAVRFEVSLRTVYRDIRTLEAAGVPISGEAGVGYSLAEGYKLPPVMFDEPEALALMAAEKFIGDVTDQATAKAYASALAKIRSVLRSGERDSVERLEQSIVLRSSPRMFATEHLSELFAAIASQRVVAIHYRKPHSKAAEWRDVESIGCYFHYQTWYLIAWCRLRQDYRTFRVNRIRGLELREEHFRDIHPSAKEYIEREAQEKQSYRVEVLFPGMLAEYVEYERFNYGLVHQEAVGEQVKMTFLVSSYHPIGRWLMTFTNHVEILYPEALKALMRRFVSELNEHYLPESSGVEC